MSYEDHAGRGRTERVPQPGRPVTADRDHDGLTGSDAVPHERDADVEEAVLIAVEKRLVPVRTVLLELRHHPSGGGRWVLRPPAYGTNG